MEALIINKTDDTPAITLDKAAGKFEFSGKSLPEDVSTFYAPVFAWIAEYGENANPESTFVFKMTYFNTASSKIILDILMRLEELHEDGKNITVEWHYEEDDEDMQEAGEEYSEIVEVPFKFIED
jgi:hypothetical protein